MALANYRRALQIREQLFKPDHPLIAQSLNNLGFLLHLLGEYPEASLYLKRALNIRKHNLDPGHPETAISYNNFGYLLQSMGKYDEAQDNFENALKILKTISSFEHPHTKTVHKNMAKNEFLLQLNELDTIWSQISVIEKLSANDIDMTKSDMKEIFIEATKQSPRVNRVRRRLEDVKDIAKEMNEEAKFYLKLNSIIDSLILKASNIY
ncbi:MAG: tetratricopeptide repeat protein [Chloroflexi bacterium]|nr:MAG: tetratricopeptide repeat protein [Chloroflexota bacterium]